MWIFWMFVFGIIGLCLFLMYRVYRRYERRNRIQSWLAWIILGGIIVFILFLLELFPGATAYYDYQYTKSILGKGMVLDRVHVYEGPRELLLGDGYSLYVYSIGETNAKEFLQPDKAFFSKYPNKTYSSSSWEKKSWTPTPMPVSDSNFRQFALLEWNYLRPNLETRRAENTTEKAQYVIGRLLEEEGNYYAYSAYMHGAFSPGNISPYVLSPKDKWLIVIHHDT